MSSPELPRPAGSAAPIFAALGDPTRLSILARLSDGETRSIAALSADTDLTRQAVTKHLRVLEDVGLVSSLRAGRETRFSLQPAPIDEARSYLEQISGQWDAAIGRLKRFVEDAP